MAMNKEGIENQSQRPHIAFLCSPGMGHIIPFAELAKRLVRHHGFSVTFLTFSNFFSPIQSAFLASLPPSISTISLPLISSDDLSPADVEARVSMIIHRSVPHVQSALQSLHQSNRLCAFIPDFLCPKTLSIAKELFIPNYIFIPSNFMLLSFLLYLPRLHETTTCQYHDLPEPLCLPGCVPICGKDFIDQVQDRTSESYERVLRLSKNFADADGFLVNSFEQMEPEVVKAFKDWKHGPQLAYAVGPFARSDMSEADKDEPGCLAWLNKQPSGSVLFTSFGSGGTLRTEQMKEIAFGLEESKQRFLWVVHSPSDTESNGNFLGLRNHDNSLSYLPEGFLERTKEVGMVVPSWAPQVKILSHEATGGFLSHCGWNSTLESVCHGVPMIAWPLYAEQRMNAVMLVEGVGIALRPKQREDGVVERGEIARVVRDLMEGERGQAVRCKVEELQEAAARTLADGGPSYEALKEVTYKWKNA